MFKYWIILFTLIFSLPCWSTIKPFHAEYQAKFKGVSLAKGSRTLERMDSQIYQLTSQAEALGGSLNYTDISRFRITEAGIQTLGFKYKERALLGTTEAIGYPDRNGGLIVSVDKERHHFPAPEGIQQLMDPAAFSIQMQLDIQQGQTDLFYYYTALDELKDQDYQVIKNERITTALGEFDTLKIEHINSKNRRTWLWVAPDLDYHLIKSEIIRKGKSWATLEATVLNIVRDAE